MEDIMTITPLGTGQGKKFEVEETQNMYGFETRNDIVIATNELYLHMHTEIINTYYK